MAEHTDPTDPTQTLSPEQFNMQVIGSSGLKQFSGFVYEEILQRLRGINGVRTYREMSDNNSVIGAILYNIDMLVRQVEWRIETPEGLDDNPQALREKEFIEGCLTDMSHTWEDFISEVLTVLVFGWSYFEIVYKLRKGDTDDPTTRSKFDDGRWGWRKIESRSQETLWAWDFDEEGGIEGIIQRDPWRPMAGIVTIPIEKSLLFRTRIVKGNPEGYSLLRPAVRSWFYLKRIQEVEAIGIERDLAGMPIFEVPRELLNPNASADDKQLRGQLETMIQQVKVDERWGGIVPTELDREGKPTGFKFKLMTTGGKRMIDTNAIIKRYEIRIAQLFSAEFMFGGVDGVGALSSDASKKDMFKLTLETILNDMIASVFNRFAIGRLMSLNRVPQEFWPVLKPASLDTPDLEALGKYIQALATAGLLTPTKALENKLLSDARLPVVEEEDDELFDDTGTPTPRDASDQAAGILSQGQIDSVMSINRGIKKRELTLDAAKELAAVTLGMEPGTVERFLIAEPPEPTLAPPLPPQVSPGGSVTPEGTIPSDENIPPAPTTAGIGTNVPGPKKLVQESESE